MCPVTVNVGGWYSKARLVIQRRRRGCETRLTRRYWTLVWKVKGGVPSKSRAATTVKEFRELQPHCNMLLQRPDAFFWIATLVEDGAVIL